MSGRESGERVRILILWADDRSLNLGVRALAEGTRALALRVWPDAEVSYLSFGRGEAPMPVGDPRALVREWVTQRRGLLSWLSSFDLVLDSRAGDSFADIYGLRRLTTMTLLAAMAQRSGSPVVMSPQTIGPFSSLLGRFLARRSMKSAELVMARDAESAGHAQRLGRVVDVVTTDVVFAIPAPTREVERDVLLNVSGLLWQPGPHVDHTAYRETIRGLIARLKAAERQVTLLAHVLDSGESDNDVPVIRSLSDELDHDVEIIVPASLDDVRQAVSSARVVIGSRMHACLNALSVGTPAVALAYSRKFEPLLNDIGWAATVDLRTSTAPIDETMAFIQSSELDANASACLHRAQAALLLAEGALRALPLGS